MRRATLNYQADGLQMKSELFLEPSAQPKPGILVFPEAYGLNKHALSRAEKLAGLGYAALACDLHGQALVVNDLGVSIGMLDGLYADPSKTRARAIGALRALAERPEVDSTRIGAIGFCFGGTMVFTVALQLSLPSRTPKRSRPAFWSASAATTHSSHLRNVVTSKPKCAVATSIGRCTSTAVPFTASRIHPPQTPSVLKQCATIPMRIAVRGCRCNSCSMNVSSEKGCRISLRGQTS